MTVLLTFADDQSAHLDLLKAESRDIRAALRPLEKKEFIKIQCEESMTADELTAFLLDLKDEITLFHYGGHAGGAALRLEDADANAKGIARLLAEQQNLKLVFLNGCSTRGQVETLFAAGVKAVVATSTPIADPKAKDFAVAFYDALANKRTIRRAFDIAKGVLEMKYRSTPTIEIVRSIGFADGDVHAFPPLGGLRGDTEGVEMPWNLYVKEGFGDEILDFRLPSYRKIDVPTLPDIAAAMPTNRYLMLVLSEMCQYNQDIFSQMVEMRRGDEVQKDSSTYLDLVVRNFPFVIGSQIQLLRQTTAADADRLEQLVSTYIVVGQTLYYILLSDFWGQKDKMKFPTTPDFLKNHGNLTAETLPMFPFFEKISDLYALFPEKDNLFVPEFTQLVINLNADGSPLKAAIKYLDILRGTFRTATDLPTACDRAELMLSVVLKEAAFLAGYQMLTVRNIELDNPRARSISYELKMAPLNAVVHTSLSFYNDDIYRRKVHYTNCDSVVLVSGNDLLNEENALGFYLNLSPFIMDKNTFLAQPQVDLFLFAYEKADNYYYYALRHNVFIALENEKGTDIVHTAMTRDDFKEGRNITANAADKTDDFDAVFTAAFGTAAIKTKVDTTPVFADLENQFEQFKTEFA